MNEAQVVEGMALIADDQAPKVSQPGEEALDLPAAAVAAQRPPILGLGTHPSAAMRRDHLDAPLRQGRPRPSARRGSSPTNGSNTAHCSSV